MAYSISVFSDMTGLTIDTLRYYEKEGLILPKRDQQNRRQYTENDLALLDFILKLKKTGMTLKNIKSYAQLHHEGEQTMKKRLDLLHTQATILQSHRQEVDGHIQFLQRKINIYTQLLENQDHD